MRSEPAEERHAEGAPPVFALVEAWVTGRELTGVERIGFAEHEVTVAPMIDVLLAPAGSAAGTASRVIEYEGRFVEVGDEMTIEGHTLELQDYAAAGFLEVVGPMVVRLGDTAGWEALLEDADRAHSDGEFPAHLLHPGVLLGERNAFLARAAGRPRAPRPVFGVGGVPRHAPEGPPLEVVGSPLVEAFGGVIEPARLEADVEDRPWLGRYIAATELLRRTRRGTQARISGVSASLLDDGRADRPTPIDAPFLSEVDGSWLLEDLATRRRFRLQEDAATIVEALHTSSDHDLAARRWSDAFALSLEEAAAHVAAVAARWAEVSDPALAPTREES
ncbi:MULTISPECIES: daptide biosynthesis RiPP recognition protein [unclassified Rathayibacter]|uniref:daptide biosynthesis RiPP recognition protein n=1 Tax=unclassified Rathayibacter TaxID=2609250 RepID=UPI00188C5FE2|nr:MULTISPECIES: daptide biosynthesis RiPP recognition protein [unclassified Rathayibacter]MBF4461829.1 hypothetical protein [Rathayibacter sp. VKM Ac-2879]MBF4503242.1 hypothetical protein [Rathayibacter sp. VKM Ac-2878]